MSRVSPSHSQSQPCSCKKGLWVYNLLLGSRLNTWQLAYQVGSLLPSSPSVLLQLCRYLQLTSPCTARTRPPNLALKHIYHETGVPSEIRIKISNSSILSIDDFANLDESSAELLVGIVSILGGVEPFGEGAAATVAKTKIVSAWRKARTHMLNNESLTRWTFRK